MLRLDSLCSWVRLPAHQLTERAYNRLDKVDASRGRTLTIFRAL